MLCEFTFLFFVKLFFKLYLTTTISRF